MKKFKLYLLRYKKHYIAGAIFTVLTSLSSLFTPWILKYVIDDLAKKISYSIIIKYAGYILGVSVIEGIFRFFMRKITIGASRQIEYDLRNDYFEHLQKLPLSFYDQNNTGDLMSRGTSDLNAIRMLLGPGIMYSADTITTFIFAFTMMVMISPKLTLISLIPLFILAIFVTKMGSYLQKSHKLVQEKTSAISQASQEYLSGIKVIKSFVQENTADENFYGTSYDYLKANLGVAKIWGAFFPLMFFMSGLSTLIILLFGGKAVVFGKISLGGLVAFHGFLSLLVWPMMAIGWVVNLFQAGIASIKRIDHVFNEVPPAADRALEPSERILKGKIEFKNLTFTYSGSDTPVLQDINFTINPGETIALMGKIGTGKTSLVNLIPRLYDVENGMIFIDDEDINNIPPDVIRRQTGVVPQETFLFSDTIKNNIVYGVSSFSGDLIDKITETAGMDMEINQFPDKFETPLGERGINISGGQKQRLAIARALITNPNILIFDDCFSSMDTSTERLIMKNLRGIMKNKTTIIISHRTSTIRMADRIIVLDKGRIIEKGTHEELLGKKGTYFELYNLERLKEELESGGQ